MIGGINSVSLSIASVYNQNNAQLSETLTRIASGKKINRPSDDFSGYVRANLLQNDVDAYQKIKENLTGAKAATGVAVEVGNSVYEDLVALKDLITSYYDTSDTTERSEISTKFTNLKNSLSTLIANTSYDGTTAFSVATLESVALDPDGTATLEIEFVAGDIADPSTPTISGTEATDITAINTQITAATSYLVKAEAYDKAIDRQIRISDTIIQSKQSAISMITDIDEVQEMNKQTDLQVRQQASIAMLAQANVSRSSIARLFE